ncbi:hypothetical protein Y919_08885 [Caloranaerobacter azorensis H53214]|uniref:Uncharacterized protein n=1 Tax=Caloranaerobacter azorensis H53214 TaxID=1156417 RepID=A0A096BGF1_9FIRM|nr:ankyrin repeat domain-containing protein [Caloranaerobacter azorensis]KGG79952.1 hypothetical protein Y919_08885 [Caloranaerobacter azorensis H53214]
MRDLKEIFKATAIGNYEMAKYLVEKGMGVNGRDYEGYTPIHWAAQGGHLDIIKLLAENGGDLEAQDDYGQTPLYVAASLGHVDIEIII